MRTRGSAGPASVPPGDVRDVPGCPRPVVASAVPVSGIETRRETRRLFGRGTPERRRECRKSVRAAVVSRDRAGMTPTRRLAGTMLPRGAWYPRRFTRTTRPMSSCAMARPSTSVRSARTTTGSAGPVSAHVGAEPVLPVHEHPQAGPAAGRAARARRLRPAVRDGGRGAVGRWRHRRLLPDRADRRAPRWRLRFADALQGRGIGTRMLERLAEIARERGVHAFDAYVLGDNRR